MKFGSQDPHPQPPSATWPWAVDPHASEKTRVFKLVAEKREAGGIFLSFLVETLHSYDDVEESSYAYNRIRKFVHECDGFRTEKIDGMLLVQPSTEWLQRFHLTASKHEPKPPADEGMGAHQQSRESRAKRTARGILGSELEADDESTRGALLHAAATKREATEDVFRGFEAVDDPGPDGSHLFVPYATRFNSPRRVERALARYRTAWECGREYHRAVVLMLSTHTIRFDSPLDAADEIMQDVNRVKAWIAARFCDGTRPPSIVVPEFTDAGYVHLHIVLFGVPHIPHPVLSSYWDDRRDRGNVVWCDSVVLRGDLWTWRNGKPKGCASASPRSYLEKTLLDALSFAKASPTEVRDAARALRQGNVESPAYSDAQRWWKLALYWATDIRFFTLSPSLKGSNDEDLTDGVADSDHERSRTWRYVGTARYQDFPAYMTGKNALVLTREGRQPPDPPPESDRDQPASTGYRGDGQ